MENVAFEFWHFSPIFVLLDMTYLVTLFDQKVKYLITVFENHRKSLIQYCERSELRLQAY